MRIELGCDVGEGAGQAALEQETALIRICSAVHVAGGGHAGDDLTIARTIAEAVEAGVAVGAHPGYPDRRGFGRRSMDLPDDVLRDSLVEQIERVASGARDAGVRLRHVKAHGALYNLATTDDALATIVASAVAAVSPQLAVVGPPDSALLAAASRLDLPTISEGFADRAYEADGSLRSRSLPGALHGDPETAAMQAVALTATGRYQTLCVHGDTPGATAIAAAVRSALIAAGHEVPGGPGAAPESGR